MIETKVAGFRPFALERYFAEHEFSITFNLAASDCETLSVQALLSCRLGRVRFGRIYRLAAAGEGLTELREVACRLREWAPGRSSYGRSG